MPATDYKDLYVLLIQEALSINLDEEYDESEDEEIVEEHGTEDIDDDNIMRDVHEDIHTSYILCTIKSGNKNELSQDNFYKDIIIKAANLVAEEDKSEITQQSIKELISDIEKRNTAIPKKQLEELVSQCNSFTSKEVVDNIIINLQDDELYTETEIQALAQLGSLAVILKQERKGPVKIEDLFKTIEQRIDTLAEEQKEELKDSPETVAQIKENLVQLSELSDEARQALQAILK